MRRAGHGLPVDRCLRPLKTHVSKRCTVIREPDTGYKKVAEETVEAMLAGTLEFADPLGARVAFRAMARLTANEQVQLARKHQRGDPRNDLQRTRAWWRLSARKRARLSRDVQDPRWPVLLYVDLAQDGCLAFEWLERRDRSFTAREFANLARECAGARCPSVECRVLVGAIFALATVKGWRRKIPRGFKPK